MSTQQHSYTIHTQFHPIVLLACGILTFVPYMLTKSLVFRIIQMCYFFFLASHVKKVRVGYFLFLIVSVTMFYVFIPNGKVLFSIGIISITDGALYDGIFRGCTLCGYVFLSLWSVSPKLSLPGKIGMLFSLSLRFFDIILQNANMVMHRFMRLFTRFHRHIHRREHITHSAAVSKSLAQHIDDILYATITQYKESEQSMPSNVVSPKPASILQGLFLVFSLIGAILVSWSWVIISYVDL